MHPILFQFGPFKIYSYGLAVACAFLVAAYLASREARRQNFPAEKMLNLCLYAVIAGIIGARLLYVLQNYNFYLQYPQKIIMLYRGGLSFYGGLILATIFVIVYLKRQNLPIAQNLDIIAPYLALAQSIGRIGCFFNGCCYGKPTTAFFAVYFPGENIPRHPVQLYNSLNLLLIFVLLRTVQSKADKRAKIGGRIFLLYCLFYSLMRFFMEYLRGDNLRIFANLTAHQLISIFIFLLCLIIWQKKS